MRLFKYKHKRFIPIYVVLGVLYALSMMHLSIPLSDFFPVPLTWDRDIFTVIVVIGVIIISVFEKKKIGGKYLWILTTAMLITFITGYAIGVVMVLFTPIPSVF